MIAQSGVQEGDNLFSISDAELKKEHGAETGISVPQARFDYRGTLGLNTSTSGWA